MMLFGKNYNSSIYSIEHLMQFYKRFFCVFFWLCNLSPSMNHKLNRVSYFLKKFTFIWLLLSFIFFIQFWKIFYCNNADGLGNIAPIEMILLVKIWSILTSISSFLFNFGSFKNLLFEFEYLDKLILKRLNHKTDYFEIRRSFSFIVTIILSFPMLFFFNEFFCGGLSPTWFTVSMFFVSFTCLYIYFHLIFLINCYLYIYNMFCKYVHFAYQLKQSNLDFPCINNTAKNLRFYKEIHYKLWYISCELNNVFGLQHVAFSFQTVFDITSTMCVVLTEWGDHHSVFTDQALSILSIFNLQTSLA